MEKQQTSLDRLFTNIAEMIKEETDPHTNVLTIPRLTKLAEAIYIEIVADYQQEPCAYGQEEEEDLAELFPVGTHVQHLEKGTGAVICIDEERATCSPPLSPILVRWDTDLHYDWMKPEEITKPI